MCLDDLRARAMGLPSVAGTQALQLELDVVLARRLVRGLGGLLGFTAVGTTKLETAASELGRNAIKYAGGGRMEWCALGGTHYEPGLKLIFVDEGPGIPDLEAAMRDGYTTGGGLGLGLPGSKRLVEHFELSSSSGNGTKVVVARWIR